MPVKEHSICEGIIWIDVADPSTKEMDKLSKDYGLNNHLVRDCMEPAHLPKYDIVDDVHFLILRYYNHGSSSRLTTIQELTNKIAIFYSDKFLITIRKEEVQFLNIIRSKHVGNGNCTAPVQVVTKVIWQALETFDDPAERLSEQVDFYENQIILKRTNNDQVEALYFIKRQASVSIKVLLLMLDPINHIKTSPEDEAELQDVRDQHLKIQTLYTQVLEDVNNLMNLYVSFSAQKTNDVMKILTIFSVFFMPLTFIVGIYGMNFEFMPELRMRWGYPVVLISMVIITGIFYQWFKRRKWF
jgi:magnesium transporter